MNFVLLTLLLAVSMQAQPPTRKLLLFGKVQVEHQQQLILLQQDSAGMAERDLVIITVGTEPGFKKYHLVPNEFAVILIGRDGVEKYRSYKPVEIETIFRLIDSMPMRQAEMDRRKN